MHYKGVSDKGLIRTGAVVVEPRSPCGLAGLLLLVPCFTLEQMMNRSTALNRSHRDFNQVEKSRASTITIINHATFTIITTIHHSIPSYASHPQRLQMEHLYYS
jgi:hypothetical protein